MHSRIPVGNNRPATKKGLLNSTYKTERRKILFYRNLMNIGSYEAVTKIMLRSITEAAGKSGLKAGYS